MVKRVFVAGILCGVFLCACAGMSIKYYGMDGVDYENGKLLGPTPKDDLPFDRCQPSDNNPRPCVVMFAGDFFTLKADYEDTKIRLKACEQALQEK